MPGVLVAPGDARRARGVPAGRALEGKVSLAIVTTCTYSSTRPDFSVSQALSLPWKSQLTSFARLSQLGGFATQPPTVVCQMGAQLEYVHTCMTVPHSSKIMSQPFFSIVWLKRQNLAEFTSQSKSLEEYRGAPEARFFIFSPELEQDLPHRTWSKSPFAYRNTHRRRSF